MVTVIVAFHEAGDSFGNTSNCQFKRNFAYNWTSRNNYFRLINSKIKLANFHSLVLLSLVRYQITIIDFMKRTISILSHSNVILKLQYQNLLHHKFNFTADQYNFQSVNIYITNDTL